jgi:hypothetical protein
MPDSENEKRNEAVTQDQHYVPRFYLKRFADSKNFLQVLKVKDKILLPPRPYSSVCYGSFFYAAKSGKQDEISQGVEKWLKWVEGYIAGKLAEIIDKIHTTQPITDGDKYVLSVLFSMLWIRGPMMRRQINRMQEDMMKSIMKLSAPQSIDAYMAATGTQWSEDEKKEIITFFSQKEYSIDFGNEQHLRFMIECLGLGREGFTNLFHYQKWRIYIAHGKESFVTSDSPVVEWSPPNRGFFGTAFPDREHYLALTPEILLCLSTPMGSTKAKRNNLYDNDIDNEKVIIYNLLIASHSYNFVYSRDRGQLETILTGLEHPGRAELHYYNKYERPFRNNK